MAIKEFVAHDDTITCMTLVDDPLCILTSSKDKKCKIWSIYGILLGEINTNPSMNQIDSGLGNKWKFTLDWERLKQNEVEEVIQIFEDLNGEPALIDENKLNEEVPVEHKDYNRKNNLEKDYIFKIKRHKPIKEFKKHVNENNNDDAVAENYEV